ncbi:MAG: hypothetical protein U0R44_00030 [Candidatus Micrarchaeia archaeon]
MSDAKLASKGDAQSDSGVKRMTTMLRERTLAEPRRGFADYASRARSKLDMLAEEIGSAKSFVATTGKRGDLSPKTLHAETVCPKLIIAFYHSLEALYAKAVEGQDPHPFKCISVASNSLVAYMRRGSIVEPIYYPSDNDFTDHVVTKKIATAREIHENVIMALDGTHTKLGVSVPEISVV